MRLGLLACVLLLLAGGCSRDPSLELREWTLEAPGQPPRAVTVPAMLPLPLRELTYTLRTEVVVPPAWRDQPLTLALPLLPAHARLRAGGHAAVRLNPGQPGYRDRGWQAFRLTGPPPGDAPLLLELDVDHTWLFSGKVGVAPRLSPTPRGDGAYLAVRLWNEITDILAVGFLSLIALSYLTGWGFDRRRSDHFWFGMQGLCAIPWPLLSEGHLQWLGTWDHLLASMSMTAAIVCCAAFAYAHFAGRSLPGHWWLAFTPMALLGAGVAPDGILLGPYGRYFPLLNFLYAALALRLIWRLTRGRPEYRAARLVLFGCWGVLIVSAGMDFAWFLGGPVLLGGAHVFSFGLTLFVISQSLVLSRERVGAMARGERLNLELEARVAELEARQAEMQVLSDELRRQIADRSRDLEAALRRLGEAPTRQEPFAEGESVENRYRVIRKLGAGGMGVVYEVERLVDRRRLALKALTPGGDAKGLARFAREAQAAAQLSHPNLVSIVDVDVSSTGSLFLVMELVDGPSLEHERARFGRVDWALPLVAQIAAGLRAMHQAGVVHRDLKPGNVLLAPGSPGATPVAKIADFGIARLATQADPAAPTQAVPSLPPALLAADLTATGVVLGTPRYMAPEMVDGARDAGAAADIFSFGMMAWEMLSGELPFAEPPYLASVRGVALGTPRELRAQLPPRLRALLLRCVDVDPAARPDAAELAASIEQAG